MKKRTKIILGVIVFFAVAIYIASLYYPPVDEGTSGMIGKVKKYNAGQISEKDVKLKNEMLKDEKSLKLSIAQLEDYRTFLKDVSSDLGNWSGKINSLTENEKVVVKEGNTLKQNSKTFSDYKTYIDKNMPTLDNTISMLNKLYKKDTVNQNLQVEKMLNDYENFRIQIAQKFLKMIEAIPNAHNALIKNKQPGIIGNKENSIGLVAFGNNFGAVANASVLEFNSQTMTLGCCSKEQLNCTAGNKEAVGFVDPVENKEAIGFVDPVENKENLNNQTIGNKDLTGIVIPNKSQLNNIVFDNKTMNATASFGTQNFVGVFVFGSKNGVFSFAAGNKIIGNSSFNSASPLGCTLDSNLPYGNIAMNKDNVLGVYRQ